MLACLLTCCLACGASLDGPLCAVQAWVSASIHLSVYPSILPPQVRDFQQLRFEVAQCCAQEFSLVVELQLQAA